VTALRLSGGTKKDFVKVTKVVNGGTNGLAERQAYLALARAALTEIA
jgi:predicted chitinase